MDSEQRKKLIRHARILYKLDKTLTVTSFLSAALTVLVLAWGLSGVQTFFAVCIVTGITSFFTLSALHRNLNALGVTHISQLKDLEG